MSSSSWTLPGAATVANAITSNDYFTVRVVPEAGYLIDVTNFSWRTTRSGTGPTNYNLRAGNDGFASDIATWLNKGTTSNFVTTVNITGSTGVEFRIYGYSTHNNGGTARIAHGADFGQSGIDLAIFGTVNASGPDVGVLGNNTLVADGDTTPAYADHTDFGNVGLNQSNLVRTFTITNSGTASLGVGNITTSGTHAADFIVIAQPSNALAAGTISTFQVRFDPSATGTRTATIQFTNDAAGKSPYDFVVQGTGVAAGILRSPTSITVTTMVGTALGTSSFGVTNVGLGRLDYTISTNAAWLSVSPTSANLAETGGQQETITYSVTGLSGGTSNATVTITDSNASNSPQTVSVSLVLTNIPDPTAQSATGDGKEMMRLAWTKHSSFNVMIVYQLGSAPASPQQGTAYSVGDSVSGGGTVVYSGTGATLEHVVRTNATHYYAFYSINNNHYSPGVSANAATPAYGDGEIVDAIAYTNGVTINGVNGGNGWTSAWSVGSGTWTAETSSLTVETNYPTEYANRIRVADPGNGGQPYATRKFAAQSSGTLYMAAIVSYQYQGPWKFAGFSFVSNATEKVFIGKIPNSENNRFGLTSTRNATDYKTSGVTLGDFNTSTGNVYLMIGTYDFSTRDFKAKVYLRTTVVPETEPGSWDVATNLPANYANSIDGIRLASGALGAPDGSIGQTLYDEIRVATNWAGLLRIVAEPEIAVLGTNNAVVTSGDASPATADGTDFGNVNFAGSVSFTNVFSITNSGNANLVLTSISTSSAMGASADFTVISWPTTVLAGTRSNLVIAFNPETTGLRTALVSIANNDSDENPYTFVVQGTGTGYFETITFQGFEGSGTDTWNYLFVSNNPGTEIYVDGSTNASGLYAVALRGSASSNADPYVEFDNIDISAYAVVTLQVAFAVAGIDSGDDLELDLSYDGGTTWSGPGSTTLVFGANNTNLGFTGIGSTTVASNPWFVSLPSTSKQVKVRIRLDESSNDNSFDRTFADNIRLTGANAAPRVRFSAATYYTTETNGTVTIPVTISSSADATVRVALAGSALINSTNDYTVNGTNIIFAAGGTTTSNVVLTLVDDTAAEGLEEINLQLVNGQGTVPGDSAVTVVLLQDDDAFSVMSANLTAGTNIVDGTYTYDETAQRIIRRLRPDVLAIQEWKFTNASARAFVDSVLGTNYYYYIEPESDPNPIPNGVISRWPITVSNQWTDTFVGARDHVQVTIDIPGPRDLHVVSTHLKAGTSDAATRLDQVRELTNYIATAAFPTNDYLVVAGDLNLTNRTETTFVVLTQVVTDARQPADTEGNVNSSLGKTSPFDHVLPNNVLNNVHLTNRMAGFAFTNGMIFDTAQFDDHLLPALVEDSYPTNRAHHAVLKLFNLSTAAVPPTVTTTIASATNLTTATSGGNVTSDGGASVTNRGVVWSTSPGPTVPGLQTTNGTGTGSFSSTLTNLTPGGTYYYKAFAQNSVGTGYGAEYSLTTPCFSGIVTGLLVTVTNDIDFTLTWSNVQYATGFQLDVATSATFSTSGTQDDFTDGDFTNNPAWSGDATGYTNLTAGTLPSGVASTDGNYIGNPASTSGNNIMTIASSETSEWRFSLGSTTFSPSSANHFGVILMSDNAVQGDVTTNSFNGYYLRVGVDGATDYLELWRSSGTTKTKIGDYTTPGNFGADGLEDGLDLRITRNGSGVFELFYATGFTYASTPTSNGGTLTNTTHSSSSYFGVYSRFANTGRRVYIDNIQLGSGSSSYVAGYSNRAVGATSATVTGLTSGATYYYRVRATNEYCVSANSVTGTVTTVLLAPDIAVYGNNTLIADGDTTPAYADHTDFGSVGFINSNLVRTFTITNTGTGSLTLANVTTSGTAAADFIVLSQPSTPVAAGGTTTFQLRFDPSATGLRTATVQFANNVTGKNPYDFVVQGTGVAAGILRSPTSISVTSMVGSAPAAAGFGVTNVGLGQLIYTISTNAPWLSVSPTGDTLWETEGQQHTVSFSVTGYGAGTSNATVTITDSNASNSPQTIAVSMVLTNIPDATSNVATNDGSELIRIAWTKPGSLDVMIVHRGTNAPVAPTQGTAYNVGDAVGSGGGRVVYKGGGAYLDHVVNPGSDNYYVFYAVNNNHYSPGVTNVATTPAYGASERVEQFGYTNGVSLSGLGGGNLFTSTWSVGAGNFTVLSNGPTPNLYANTNYSAEAAQRVVSSNYVNDTEMRASRRFAAITNGSIYISYLVAVEYGGAGKYTGVRALSNTTERFFVGEGGGNDLLAIDGYGGGIQNTAFNINSFQSNTGNVYLVVARYIFSSNHVSVKGYYRTDTVPEAEPASWDTSVTASSDRSYIDGIEIVSGGFSGNQPGLVAFDEIRVSTNWAGIVPPSGVPGIGVNPSSVTVSVMRGSSPAAQTFTVTNVGQGALNYSISTSVSWIAVAPVAGSLSAFLGQIHTSSFNTVSLPVGTNIATVTVTAPLASNSPVTVTYNVIVTNIPPPTNVIASADGYEMVRLGWSPPPGLPTVMILHDDVPIATDPSQGTLYNVDSAVGLARVIYKGTNTSLEHIVAPGSTNHYAFYAVNGNYYSTDGSYTVIECPDTTATNLVAGDIAIFGLNTLTSGSTNYDSFGFITLTDLPTGTAINFTDNGWRSNDTFRTGEGTITWSATSCVPAGTVIRWISTNTPQVTVGSITTNSSFAPNIDGEQVLAYQGPATNPTFIYALGSHTDGVWHVDATDTHESALPRGLTNGLTAVVIAELNNVVISTNTLAISGDRAAILSYFGNTNNWVGDDSIIFDLLAYNFSFPDLNTSGGGVMTNVTMGLYRTNEIVDVFAYTNGNSISSPARNGGWGWTSTWTGAAGTWTALTNNTAEISFPSQPLYPTNAANILKLTDPGVSTTGRMHRYFQAVTNGSLYFSGFLSYQYEGFNKFAGFSFMSGGAETGFMGKISSPSHSFTLGIDTYGGSRVFAAYDLRGQENSTNNTYLIVGKYDFDTDLITVQSYYRGVAVPDTEPADWAATATVSGAGISLIDGIRVHGGADVGTIGNCYFDEIRVASSWGALINRNPPTVLTRPVSNILISAATGGGEVTSDGGATVTNRGVVYSTNALPVLTDSRTSDGTGTGIYASVMTNLIAGETYYVRAYAQNAAGTSFGAVSNFTTLCFTSVVTGLYANPTNSTDFTANWSALTGAARYQLDVSSVSNFTGNAPNYGVEVFTNIGGGTSSSYLQRNWTNNNIAWSAFGARTDQTIDGAAIALEDASGAYIVSGSITGGISELSVVHQMKFSGVGSTFDIFVNSTKVATNVAFDANIQTARVTGINVSGSFTISISNRATSAEQLALDTLTWTNDSSAGSFIAGYDSRSVTGTSQSVTGLLEGATYYFRVRAVGGGSCVSGNSSTVTVVTVDNRGPSLFAFNVDNRTNTDAMIRNGFAVTGLVYDAGYGVSNGVSTPYYLIRNNAGTTVAASNKFTTAPANGSVVTGNLAGTFSAVPQADVTLGIYTAIVGAVDLVPNVSVSNFFFTVVDDDTNIPEQVTLMSTNTGGGNLRFMQISIGAANITLGGGATSNLFYPTTDGALAAVAAANPLLFWMGARDESGLNRGTSTPTTNMNFTLDAIVISNTANFDATRSSSFASTTNTRATNVWAWTSPFTSDELTTLITNTVNGLGTNRISLSLFDADDDRIGDALTLIDRQYGYLVVTDDDTVVPTVGSTDINGVGAAGQLYTIFTETMGTAGTSGESIATHETNNRFDNTAFTMSGTGDARTTTASTGYDGASGSFNILLNAVGETFIIADINSSAYTNMSLVFGVYKSSTSENGSSLVVEVSTNGTTWNTLTIPALPTGAGTADWYSRTNSAGTIPSGTNLQIRFTGNTTSELRLDDVKLINLITDVSLTDGQIASGGYVVTSRVSDATSGIAVSNAFAPSYLILNQLGNLVVSNTFTTPFANGGGLTLTSVYSTAAAAVSTNVVTLGIYTTTVYVTDADADRNGDRLSSTGTPFSFTVIDDDTNAPVVSAFQLAGGTTNFDLSLGSIAITGLLTDASSVQYGGLTHILLLDNTGGIAQSNRLFAGTGSAATGTLSDAGLNCGNIYTVRLFAADADLDRPADQLFVTNMALVIQTTGTGGPADYPIASNLLVSGSTAAPTTTVFDATIRTGGWSLAMSLSHPVGVFTNATSPSFRVTNLVAEVIALMPWSNAVQSGNTYFFTNAPLPGAAYASVNTGIHFVVWSASNQGSCVASIIDRPVITGGTNVFAVVDEDEAVPVLSGFTLPGGGSTVSVATAFSGFAITGLIQDAGSGVAFTSQPPYALFYDVSGSVLASNAMLGGTEGNGTSPVAFTNWFSGITLSCGNFYTVRVFAADADNDRASDRTSVSTNVMVVATEGSGGDAPTAQDLLVNNTAASSVTLYDETIATGGWQVALVMSHSSGNIVTNGPNAPSFLVQNQTGTHVYSTSPLVWSNIVKSGVTYYATNTPMPAANTNWITTGTYSFVWSAQSDGLCFGVTNGSGNINPGTNKFLVVDDDVIPPNMSGISVAGGTGSVSGASDCADPTATNLLAGDIAIYAINTKTGSGTNNDSFAFVALVDIPTGTQIKFTDNGWKSSTASFRNNEGTITWMATGCVPAGTSIRWIATNTPLVSSGQIIATNGTFAPNIQGEQILAYQGSESSPNFLYAVNDRLNGIWDVDAVDSHSSAIPPGLIDGYTAVAVGEFDNIIINTNNLTITGDRDQILYYIGDKDNWIGSDTNVFDLLQFNFTFPDANAGGGAVTDQDILFGGWSITGLVQDVGSGLLVSNGPALRYVVLNTNSGVVVSNYFYTTFTNGTKVEQNLSNAVSAGSYSLNQLGTFTAQLYAADADVDRIADHAERNTNVPFQVVDDDTDYPQIGFFYINGQTTITNPAELSSVVLSGQVRDVTSGIAFTSEPPTYAILDSTGGVAASGGFTYGPTNEGAGLNWTNLWTTNLNLTGIADCGTYTVRVTIADADNDRPVDRRETNLTFLISVASGNGSAPIASNLLVNATAASAASISDATVAAGGWSLAVSMYHPSGLRIDAPYTPTFVLRNAAVTGVSTQEWTNIVTAGSSMYATNSNMPAIGYSSIDTGYYTVVWSARSQGSCFGETNFCPFINGDTNRFLVFDDDVTAPANPSNVASPAAYWTNLANVQVSWLTNNISDASSMSFYITTNRTVPVSTAGGVTLGMTNAYIFTNAAEGVYTNWVFAADADNDRVSDSLMSAITSFVMYVDRTAPTQVVSFAAVVGANDNTSEIDLNWGPLADAGNSNLSPWASYIVYYTDEATGPFTTSSYVTAMNGGPAGLGTNTTSSITLQNFEFDTTYRVAIAGMDRAGNIGPMSTTQTVTLGVFALTQGLAAVTEDVDLYHTAVTGKQYDLIYVDAVTFADSLTSYWNLAQSGQGTYRYDTGAASRVPPIDLGGATMRFYRAAQEGRWTITNVPNRVASVEVYAAKPLTLSPGQNFVSLFAIPDTNRVDFILGTNKLPAGGTLATSTVVSFYGVSTNGHPDAVSIWLSDGGYWLYSTGGLANHQSLPLYEGFNIALPTSASTQKVLLVGRIPTNTVVQSLSPNAYNVVSYTVPRRMRVSELGLREAGLTTGATPSTADEIRILQRGLGSLTTPKVRIIHNGTNFVTWPAKTSANNYMIEADDAIIIYRRPGSTMSWTNKLYYTPPVRNMNP